MALRVRVSLLIFALSFAAPLFALNVSVTSYRGQWAATATYGAGMVVTFDGASYISLVGGNVNVTPGSSAAKWAILNSPGAPGPKGATGSRGPRGAYGGGVIVDSRATVVGGWLPGIEPDPIDAVIMNVSGVTFWTAILKDGFRNDDVGFHSHDCTGTAYEPFGHDFNSILPHAIVQQSSAYVMQPLDPNTTVYVYSLLRNAQCINHPTSTGSYEAFSTATAVASAVLDVSGYVPPFSVQLQ